MSYSERSKRRSFGESWWGQAWVEAIEAQPSIGTSRLPRGRTYARLGYVGDLVVESGVVHALVEGSDPSPYRTTVRVRPFDEAQWAGLLDIVATKVAHAAALADGELTSELTDDAIAAGIELLPSEDEISTACTCADEVDMCKHAAAVCYLFADLLDDDPFSLLELRGRTQEQIAAELRDRRRPTTETSPDTQPARDIPVSEETISALVAFASYDRKAKLPKVPRPPLQGHSMAIALHDLPRSAGVDANDIGVLGATAAQRASEMCAGYSTTGRNWTLQEDLAWRGSLCIQDEAAVVALAERAGVDENLLFEDARVWNDAGRSGFHDIRDPWEPPEASLANGVAALSDYNDVVVNDNTVTSLRARTKLLLGKSGRWYRFERSGSTWEYQGPEDFEL